MDLVLLQQAPTMPPMSAFFVCYVPLAVVVIGLVAWFVITDRHASRPYARLLPVEGIDDVGMATTDPTNPPLPPAEGIPPRSGELRPAVPTGTGMQQDTVEKEYVPTDHYRTDEAPPLRDDRAFTGEQVARVPSPDDAQSPPPPAAGAPPAVGRDPGAVSEGLAAPGVVPPPSNSPAPSEPPTGQLRQGATPPSAPVVPPQQPAPGAGSGRRRSSVSYEAADPTRAPNDPVRIVAIHKGQTPEVVVLQNVSNAPVDLTGWQVVSVRAFQVHRGVSGVLQPGETKEFPYTGSGKMWNNRERDDGALYDPNGRLISYWSDSE